MPVYLKQSFTKHVQTIMGRVVKVFSIYEKDINTENGFICYKPIRLVEPKLAFVVGCIFKQCGRVLELPFDEDIYYMSGKARTNYFYCTETIPLIKIAWHVRSKHVLTSLDSIVLVGDYKPKEISPRLPQLVKE